MHNSSLNWCKNTKLRTIIFVEISFEKETTLQNLLEFQEMLKEEIPVHLQLSSIWGEGRR